MVEWQLTEAFMRGLSAFYQLHAAVAVYRGSNLILSGPSEVGKTSLLVGLTAAGAWPIPVKLHFLPQRICGSIPSPEI